MYETYNDNVIINGEYYKHIDMNYGFAHFIAKYLDYKYPILDAKTRQEYQELIDTGAGHDTLRGIDNVISLSNYFLCSNRGKRLRFGYPKVEDDREHGIDENDTERLLYREIYNRYMIPIWQETQYFAPVQNGKYMVMNDLPLFVAVTKDGSGQLYWETQDTIFSLDKWSIEKGICEIDDFVASYLLGRTITPESSMEEIYYVQKLLIHDRTLAKGEKGVWCMKGCEGTEYDLTQTIINYQKNHVNALSTTPLFVTGYFDIYTEAALLKEVGEDTYGISAL